MFFVPIVLYIMAAVIFYDTPHTVQFWSSLFGAATLISIHWFIYSRTTRAMSARLLKARNELIQEGASPEEVARFEENTKVEPKPGDVEKALAPVGLLHMIIAFGGVVMLAWGFILQFF